MRHGYSFTCHKLGFKIYYTITIPAWQIYRRSILKLDVANNFTPLLVEAGDVVVVKESTNTDSKTYSKIFFYYIYLELQQKNIL